MNQSKRSMSLLNALTRRQPAREVPAMYRHGDVLVARVEALPEGVSERGGTVLARGELTGHSHRVREGSAARVWERGDELFLEVTGPLATLVHEEHGPIPLPRGLYRVWMQREYSPEAIRRVVD